MMVNDPIRGNISLFTSFTDLGKLLGLSKSAALALGLLFVEPEPLSLDEVASSTSIAKSSVSVILKNLEQMGLVEAVGRANDRRKFYRAVDDFQDAIAAVVARRLENAVSRQDDVLTSDPASHSPFYEFRLEQLKSIYESLALLASFFRARRSDAWDELKDRLSSDHHPGKEECP